MNARPLQRPRLAITLVVTQITLIAILFNGTASFATQKAATQKPATLKLATQKAAIHRPTTQRQAVQGTVTSRAGTSKQPTKKPGTAATMKGPVSAATQGNATITAVTVPTGSAVSEILVAGASDLRPAFEEIGKLFTSETGTKVTFSFGSSGQLAQQISNGAPFDVFASADQSYVDQVLSDGIGDASTKATYAFGRLALWVPSRTQKRIFNVLDLSDPSLKRIAIANPEHAPYGAAAVQALKSAKIYELISDKLVYGENVSDTYRLATSGNADAALVSLSLVIANSNGGQYIVVPSDAHTPLEQALVVTAKKSRSFSAKAFVTLVRSATGRTIMRKYGFLLPGDPKPLNANN